MMFRDEDLDGVEFNSSWRNERSLVSSKCQTIELTTSNAASQSRVKRDQEIQTDPEPENIYHLQDDNSQALVDFLKRVEPVICRALDKNIRSHAFDGYQVDWETNSNTVSCLHVIQHKDFEKSLQCVDLSWSKTGSTLAVAYGRLDHENWCQHKGALCTWNLDRRSVDCGKADQSIDVPSCLMCVSFHPTYPAWIAGGSFNGQVIVWDLNEDEDHVLALSGMGDDSHHEPVTQVRWIQDPDRPKKYLLLSASSDGRMFIWELKEKKKALEPKDGFMLLSSSMPATSSRPKVRGDKEMGVNSISYMKEDPSIFIVGSESGGVFKCSMNARGPVPTMEGMPSIPLHSAVIFAFEPHNGPVHAVSCSPFHRNLFLSCGTDSSARIYSMLEPRHILSVETGSGYLFKGQWSPVRPMVFAVVTGSGQLLIYDLKENKSLPAYSLQASPEKKEVYALQFNQNQRQLLATGDADGVVMIWQLNDELTNQGAKEINQLAEIASSAFD